MTKEVKKHIKCLNNNSDKLKKEFKIKRIAIFGSTSRGDNSKKSDIDILVELSEPISLFKFIELENFLKNILKKKVDLTTKEALKPAIKQNILKDAVYA